MTVAFLVIVISVLVIWVIDLLTSLGDARTERDHYHAEFDRVAQTMDQQRADNQRLLTVVAPLMEQTDWMTGRWGGQFQTLVSLENKRNEYARAARRVFFDHVDMKAHLASTPIEDVMPNLTGAVL